VTLRQHLIVVTRRILAAHGLTGLTTRAIAREAQVSDGVLYNHFSDKDELVLAALGERVDELVETFVADGPEPGRQDLAAGLAQLVRACLDFQSAVLPLVAGLVTRPDLLHRLFDQVHAGQPGPRRLWAAIGDFVRAEQELGTVAEDVDPTAAAEALFGLCQMQVLPTLLAEDQAERDGSDSDRAVAFLLRAMRPVS
jgi:AcrR family transcriptional regulator